MIIAEPKPGHFTIGCSHCGKPISKTSSFGMDCEDDCEKKDFHKNPAAVGLASLLTNHADAISQLFTKDEDEAP